MASKTQIANLALNVLGEPPILDLSEDNKAGRVMNLLFDDARDAVLRLHPWNFATKRAVLAKSTAAPTFGFTSLFILPADYLRLMRLNDGKDQYQIEADGLLTSVSEANLRYIARIEDTAKFDPLFVQCLAAFLASEAAMTITNSQTMEDRATEKFREKLQEARSVDGMENYQEVLVGDAFIEVFLGGEEDFRPIAKPTP